MAKNKLMGNIVSLFTLKGAEYIISFITLPYLLRVLGPDKYGAITFAQVIMNYGILLVDYGFNLTAPRDIAKADKGDVSQHFAAIMGAKFILLVPILCLGVILLTVFQANIDIWLILCVLPLLLGNVLFPIWYFQGIQQMQFITVFNLLARTASVLAIFILIRSTADYRLAAFLQSIVPLLAGIISLIVLWRRSRELFCLPKWQDVISKFKDGWDIFISTLFINLYTNSNIFILGILTNDTVVGYYSAANKLIEAVKGLLTPISNAIFPHVSVLFKESKVKAIKFLCKVMHILGCGSFSISLMVFILAEPIVHLVMGEAYRESVLILQIISFLPFIIGLSNIFGIQTMVAFGMQRIFSRILMISAIVNFVLIFPMVMLWQGLGLAITVVIVECFVTITMYVTLIKHNIVIK